MYGLRVPKIEVFTLGDDITRAPKAVKPAGVPDVYILSVGTIEGRKNHQLLYYALKGLIKEHSSTPPIVIAGRRGWLSADFQYMAENDPDIQEKIIIMEKITDSELRWLYENCLFTIFPSFYEGWGLPIAESLGYGKVTLASDTSSMLEVGDKFADYFSPFSPDQLSDLLLKYQDLAVRQKREESIKKGYKTRTWDDCAKSFAELVEELTS
jgi:glycosyltransferase involved in cell wall biosynthesis